MSCANFLHTYVMSCANFLHTYLAHSRDPAMPNVSRFTSFVCLCDVVTDVVPAAPFQGDATVRIGYRSLYSLWSCTRRIMKVSLRSLKHNQKIPPWYLTPTALPSSKITSRIFFESELLASKAPTAMSNKSNRLLLSARGRPSHPGGLLVAPSAC